MDPQYNLQDLVRCHLCDTSVPSLHCTKCNINLCKACEGKHLSNKSKIHNLVSFKNRESTLVYPKCRKHSNKQCELYCEQCKIPICAHGLSSKNHERHKVVDILIFFENKKESLRKDLQELEKTICPIYKDIATHIPIQKSNLIKNSQEMEKALNARREDWHREIDTTVQKLKSDLEAKSSEQMNVLSKLEDENTQRIYEITQSIINLKKLLESNDVNLVSAYKSRNIKFRRLPPKQTVSLPNFMPLKINKEQICQLFGYITAPSIETEEHGYVTNLSIAESSVPDKQLLDKPRIITNLTTDYGGSCVLRNISCFSDDQIWMCGKSNMMKLYNLQGEIVKSIQTKSGNRPWDISVTKDQHLVYGDYHDRTVNMIKHSHIQEVIRLKEWKPCSVYNTSSGDLLVVMNSDDEIQTKVVRYSGFEEKQTIQFNDKGQPLFLSGPLSAMKYISENNNLDICVADCWASAVVVVNQLGKFRYTYTGHSSSTERSYHPIGITTDSQSRILTVDHDSNKIHIIDQDGNFIRYIDNCELCSPWGLCVDSKDNVFVAEWKTGKVKKIQYYI